MGPSRVVDVEPEEAAAEALVELPKRDLSMMLTPREINSQTEGGAARIQTELERAILPRTLQQR